MRLLIEINKHCWQEGRYGPAYRVFLPGSLHMVVNILVHKRILNDEEATTRFESLDKIKHPNLVPLVGYCLAGDQRI